MDISNDLFASLQEETGAIANERSDKSVSGILRWAERQFCGQIAFASSLGLEDQVLIDVLARYRIAIPVFTLDTGRLFRQSYDLLSKTEARYGIRIKVLFPDARDVESMVAVHGINLFRNSVEQRRTCCRIRKVKQLDRELSGLSAWVTGLRREQADTRNRLECMEWDEGHGMIKLNPLADWSIVDIRRYLAEHDVPYNVLHDQGYPSIGCACCTRAVGPDEDIRAGRWWWELVELKEGGLHSCPLATGRRKQIT